MFLPRQYKRLKRGPQVILPKDIGMIIAYTGIGKNSVCIDAGTGSGWLAVALARVSKRVISYEVREEFIKIAKRNIVIENLDNIEIKQADVSLGIDEVDADLVTLDMPNSEKVVEHAFKALRGGGYVCGYLPHIEQLRLFSEEMGRAGFCELDAYEVIARDIQVKSNGTRPSTKGVWHTGYLAFGRKPLVEGR